MSSLLRAQENSIKPGDLAWAPCSPKTQGTPQGCESCSPNQKFSFAFVNLADLTMNFPTSGQGEHVLGHALVSRCIMGTACGWRTVWQQEKCSGMAGAPLLKGLLSAAGMTDWQRLALTKSTPFFTSSHRTGVAGWEIKAHNPAP